MRSALWLLTLLAACGGSEDGGAGGNGPNTESPAREVLTGDWEVETIQIWDSTARAAPGELGEITWDVAQCIDATRNGSSGRAALRWWPADRVEHPQGAGDGELAGYFYCNVDLVSNPYPKYY